MQFVYALIDPVKLDLRYIGMSADVDARISKHLREAERTTAPRGRWFRELKESDARPVSIVLDECETRADASHREKYWIARAKARGVALLNRTAGGQDGTLSDEAKSKIGERNRNRRPSLEARAKMSAAAKKRFGRLVSPETRAKISAANKGKGHSPEWRANQSALMSGRKASPETRAKMSMSQRGNTNARRSNPERKSAPNITFGD